MCAVPVDTLYVYKIQAFIFTLTPVDMIHRYQCNILGVTAKLLYLVVTAIPLN